MHFLKIRVYLGLILRILWSKVTNNFGFSKIRVFLGLNLKVLWSGVMHNFGFPKIRVFLGPNLKVLWSEVTNNFVVPEIHVLGELSIGVIISNKCQILFPSVTGKVQNSRKNIHFWAILRCVSDAWSNLVRAEAGQKAHLD